MRTNFEARNDTLFDRPKSGAGFIWATGEKYKSWRKRADNAEGHRELAEMREHIARVPRRGR